jgi:hypothetical protein
MTSFSFLKMKKKGCNLPVESRCLPVYDDEEEKLVEGRCLPDEDRYPTLR